MFISNKIKRMLDYGSVAVIISAENMMDIPCVQEICKYPLCHCPLLIAVQSFHCYL